MSDFIEHKSMSLYRAGGGELASREIAVSLATMVIGRVCGQDDLAAQLPLQVTELPGSWLIEGSRVYDDSKAEDQLVVGKVTIEIVKANCQVLRFSRHVDFARQELAIVGRDEPPNGFGALDGQEPDHDLVALWRQSPKAQP